jgi:hypothetical protein
MNAKYQLGIKFTGTKAAPAEHAATDAGTAS